MAILEKVKKLTKNIFTSNDQDVDSLNLISVENMETKYRQEDYMGAAKDLKLLLERYGRRKRKNHRYKGREFIYFILSNKHKDLKNTGYTHWENIEKFIKLNQNKVYEYHRKNLRNAMDFFEKEVKSINEIKIQTK
ncbi:hypothetical protein KHQ88_01000 [Mycoplasmatota bacterium]|nr:hypothetical protein KHQ88_01000 [Mycoplasmatota bacterium]